MGCTQGGNAKRGDLIAISSNPTNLSTATAINKKSKRKKNDGNAQENQQQLIGISDRSIDKDDDLIENNDDDDMPEQEADQTQPIFGRLSTKIGNKLTMNLQSKSQSDAKAVAQVQNQVAEEESEDEEWSFMAKIKRLKNKVFGNKKFKAQKLVPKVEETKEGTEASGAEEVADDTESSEELDSMDEFYVDPPEVGDQFMACKPWLGAIKEPDVLPAINESIPDQQFVIDFVHGYKSNYTRQNLYYNNNQHCVYMTAALGVILDPESRQQQIFGGGEEKEMKRKQMTKGEFGHSDDIVALGLNADRTLVATGQVGLAPMIFIWDAETAVKKSKMNLPKGSRSVSAIAISSDGKYLSCADMSDDYKIHLFDLTQVDKKENCVHLADAKKDRKKIFQIVWNPKQASQFVSVGLEHICFWTWTSKLVGKMAKLPPSKPGVKLGFPSVAYSQTGLTFIAASDGNVYTYNNGTVNKTHKGIHSKMVSCINVRPDPTNPANELVITGGGDKKITMHKLEANKNLTPILSYTVAATPRSVDFMGDSILAGLSNGTILELKKVTSDPTNVESKVQIRSHWDGEAWGLAMVDNENKCLYFTTGDDNTILLYDADTKYCIGEGRVSTVDNPKKDLPPKKKRGGASSMSNQHPHCQARALAFSEGLQHLAVGHNDGCISVRQIDGLHNNNGDEPINLNNIISKMNRPKEWIEIMRYSPNGDKLAVGSHDNFIYLYNTVCDGKYTYHGRLSGHSSYITALDWSIDSDYIRSSCGAYELLFFEPESKERQPGGASATTSTTWNTHTVKFGWYVDGIYPPGTDGSHINIVEMSKDQQIIATGDDYGLVNLYRSPCREGHKARSYRGHSEHVTNVKIYGTEMSKMCSLGGQDQTLIQWKLKEE